MATILSIDETLNTQENDTTSALPARLNTDLIALLGSSYATSIKEKATVANVLTTPLPANTTDVAFTNAGGTALSGVDSDLIAISGRKIFLYTYSGDNNLVIGREADADGTANPSGAIAFVAYLETNGSTGGSPSDQNATNANLWVVEFTTLQHYLNTDPANPNFNLANDFVTLAGKLNVTVTNPINFDATGAPSGANLFITYGDGTYTSDEVAVVVTSPDAADQSSGANISSGGVVKTSQAGSNLGGATFGKDSQMFDPPNGKPAESLYFTFVKGADPSLVVSPSNDLTPTEANVEDNIRFSEFFGAERVSFAVSQLQQAKAATIKISAWDAVLNDKGNADPSDDAPWTRTDYVNHQNDNVAVVVESVSVTRVVTVGKNPPVTYEWTFTENQTTNAVTIVTKVNGVVSTANASQPAAFNVSASFAGDTVVVRGAIAGDKLLYDTVGDHNRLQITNVGDADAKFNAAFDIGALKIESGGINTSPFQDIKFFDDGPAVTIDLKTGAEARVDESLGENGAPEIESGSLGSVTVTAATLFTESQAFGRDGPASSASSAYSLTISAAGADSLLDDSASGLNVLLYMDGNDVVGRAGSDSGGIVFRIAINATTGAVTLTQYRAMKHGDATDPDEEDTPLSINSGLVFAVHTIKDADNDFDDDDADIGPAMKFEDDGPSVTINLKAGAEVRVDESLGQNGVPESEVGSLGSITVAAAVLFEETAAFGQDGAAASNPTVYSLNLTSTAPDSLLDDTATGQNVLLYVDGNDIVGKTATGGDLVFRIAINATTGAVTLTQYRAMKHGDATDPDEADTPLSIASGLVAAVRTITDKDGDSDDDDADIGPALKFEDDGPSIGPVSDGIVEFVEDAFVEKSLFGAVGSDTRTSPYKLTDWTGTDAGDPAIVINGVTLKAVPNATGTNPVTAVSYWADTNADTVFGNTGDTEFYRLTLNQTANSGEGSYKFEVLQSPPVVEVQFGFLDQPSGQNLFGIIATNKGNIADDNGQETPPNRNDDYLPDGGLLFFNKGVKLDANGKYISSNSDPLLNSSTVNTSKAGGEVSIGYGANNYTAANQDAFFVFADNPAYNAVSALGLDATSADDADTVRFNGTNEVFSASVEIVKTVSSTEAGVTVKAWNLNPGNVANQLNIGDDPGESRSLLTDPLTHGSSDAAQVNIKSVTVTAVAKVSGTVVNTVVYKATDANNDGVFSGAAEITTNTGNVTVTLANGTITVLGLDTDKDYTIRYDTVTPHDMAQVVYEAGSYNIGGFNLIQALSTPDQKFDFTAVVTDGDNDIDEDSWSVGIDGTGPADNDAVDGVSPLSVTTLSTLVLEDPGFVDDSGGMRQLQVDYFM